MKTDSLFYSLFQSTPSIFFELIGRSPTESQGYRFESVEVKQTAFRLDGVFLPPEGQPDAPVYFLEVQFQRDPTLYRRLFSEVFLYLKQHLHVQRWQAVIVYPKAATEVPEPLTFGELTNSSYVQVVYLEQLGALAELSPGLAILRLMVEPEASVPVAARTLIERVQRSALTTPRSQLIELIETIVVCTFPNRSRQEIAAMLGLTDMRETRVYQEARDEGREEGREEGRLEGMKALLLLLLTREFGDLPDDLRSQVNQLSLESLTALGEALFDFSEVADLRRWLAQQEADA